MSETRYNVIARACAVAAVGCALLSGVFPAYKIAFGIVALISAVVAMWNYFFTERDPDAVMAEAEDVEILTSPAPLHSAVVVAPADYSVSAHAFGESAWAYGAADLATATAELQAALHRLASTSTRAMETPSPWDQELSHEGFEKLALELKNTRLNLSLGMRRKKSPLDFLGAVPAYGTFRHAKGQKRSMKVASTDRLSNPHSISDEDFAHL